MLLMCTIWCRLVSCIVLLPTNMTSDVVSSLMADEKRYNCKEEPTEQGALKGKIAEVHFHATCI